MKEVGDQSAGERLRVEAEKAEDAVGDPGDGAITTDKHGESGLGLGYRLKSSSIHICPVHIVFIGIAPENLKKFRRSVDGTARW